MPYYSLSQIAKALKTYHELRSVSRTVQVLGYPTRARLYFWIHEEGKVKTRKRKYSYKNIRAHPRNPPANIKLEAIRRCFENGENVVDVAEGLGYSTASIYKWRRLYLTKGALALQSCNRKKPRGPLEEGKGFFLRRSFRTEQESPRPGDGSGHPEGDFEHIKKKTPALTFPP